jgi:hypothetical protein
MSIALWDVKKVVTVKLTEWDMQVLTTLSLLEYLGDVKYCCNFYYLIILLKYLLSFLVLLGSVLGHSVGFLKCNFSLEFYI